MVAAIIALHGLPLPVLAVAGLEAVVMWLLVLAAGLSLGATLHQQRPAVGATRLEATTASGWLLYHGNGNPADAPGRVARAHTASNGNAPAGGAHNRRKVELLGGRDFGSFVLLLVARDRRKFRLAVRAAGQPREQLHRLRVMLANPPAASVRGYRARY